MTSGIYKLTFSSGKFYIGKSIDIETRWKQHFNKFALGKAARPMQVEFDRCGPPQTEVIFNCHRDHIDLLEEWLIDQCKTHDMLNTTYPDITRTEEIAELINNSQGLLEKSTWEHLQYIETYKQVARDAVDTAQHHRDIAEEYKNNGYIINQDYSDMVDVAARAVEREREYLLELQRLSKLGWWDRLWNYRVNV